MNIKTFFEHLNNYGFTTFVNSDGTIDIKYQNYTCLYLIYACSDRRLILVVPKINVYENRIICHLSNYDKQDLKTLSKKNLEKILTNTTVNVKHCCNIIRNNNIDKDFI